MNDEYTWFRLLVLGLWAVGVFGTWRTVTSLPANTITVGNRSYSKSGFIRFVVAWNAVGLPILLVMLFLVRRP